MSIKMGRSCAVRHAAELGAAEYKHVVLGLLFLKYICDCSGKLLAEDMRGPYGTPPTGNANYARIDFR